jgi:glycosyltransferase involved in cell wall biosynthesis
MDPVKPPLFSIITVCYNALPALRRTVEAVAASDFRGYEHVIIDGASRDGTPDWLYTIELPHIRWISEPDQGLYDAMNKGQNMARGEFLWFLNAGDLPSGTDTLGVLAAQAAPDVDVLYGEVLLVNPEGKMLGTRSECTTQQLPERLTWRDLRYGMVVSHQAFLPRRSLAPAYLLNNLCADIDWVITCLKNAQNVVNTLAVLARFETGGVSKQRHRRSLWDRYKVLGKHYGFLPNLLRHIAILLRAFWFRISKPRHIRYE